MPETGNAIGQNPAYRDLLTELRSCSGSGSGSGFGSGYGYGYGYCYGYGHGSRYLEPWGTRGASHDRHASRLSQIRVPCTLRVGGNCWDRQIVQQLAKIMLVGYTRGSNRLTVRCTPLFIGNS